MRARRASGGDDPPGIDQDCCARRRKAFRPGRAGQFYRRPAAGDRQRRGPTPFMIDAPNTLDVKVGERVGLMVDPHAVRVLPERRP